MVSGQVAVHGAAEGARFYRTTPKGRSIGKEFSVWQFAADTIGQGMLQQEEQEEPEINIFDQNNSLQNQENKPLEGVRALHLEILLFPSEHWGLNGAAHRISR